MPNNIHYKNNCIQEIDDNDTVINSWLIPDANCTLAVHRPLYQLQVFMQFHYTYSYTEWFQTKTCTVYFNSYFNFYTKNVDTNFLKGSTITFTKLADIKTLFDSFNFPSTTGRQFSCPLLVWDEQARHSITIRSYAIGEVAKYVPSTGILSFWGQTTFDDELTSKLTLDLTTGNVNWTEVDYDFNCTDAITCTVNKWMVFDEE